MIANWILGYLVPTENIHERYQAKNSTNGLEPRALDSEGIFFGEGNNNKFSSPINSTKSWFENFITPTLKQSEQLRLNTTSNRKSNFLSNANKTITNATVVAAEHLVTLDSKESFAKSISFGQAGMYKFTKKVIFNQSLANLK